MQAARNNGVRGGSSPPKEQANSSSKFIRKSNSQAFGAYQNMLKFNVVADCNTTPPPSPLKKPLIRTNTLSGGKPKSTSKQKQKVELQTIPSVVPSKDPIQDIAMHICANIFMRSTTRFIEGYNDLSSMEKGEKKEKRRTQSGRAVDLSINQRQKSVTPKKTVAAKVKGNQVIDTPAKSVTSIFDYNSPKNQAGVSKNQRQSFKPISKPGGINQINPTGKQQQNTSSTSLKTQTKRNPQENAYKMTGQRYLGTTTRYSPLNPLQKNKERSISQSKLSVSKPEVKPQPPKKETVISPPSRPGIQQKASSKALKNETENNHQEIAYKMTGQRYLGTTTRYSPSKVLQKSQVKSISQSKLPVSRSQSKPEVKPSPKKQSTFSPPSKPGAQQYPSSKSLKTETERRPEDNAYKMAGERYLGTTTRYVKESGVQIKKNQEKSISRSQNKPDVMPSPPNKETAFSPPSRPGVQPRNKIPQESAVSPPTRPVIQPRKSNQPSQPNEQQRNVHANAYHMAGQSFMTSTTRYMKDAGMLSKGPGRYSPTNKDSANKERSISQPRAQVGPKQVSPPQRKESVERPGIRPIGGINQSPMKSTIGIQSKTQLPVVTPIRNRFQAQVIKQQQPTPTPYPTPNPTPNFNRQKSSDMSRGRSTEDNANKMVAESYMNSTTKYVKDVGMSKDPGHYSPNKQSRTNNRSIAQPKPQDISQNSSLPKQKQPQQWEPIRKAGNRQSLDKNISSNKQPNSQPQVPSQPQVQPRYGQNRSQTSPQSKPSNSLPKNQGAKTERGVQRSMDSNNVSKSVDKDESATPRTPFSRQPAKARAPLAFTNKQSLKEQANNVKDQSNNTSQPFVTQITYGQKDIKPTVSPPTKKPEPINRSTKEGEIINNSSKVSPPSTYPRVNNYNKSPVQQTKPVQQNTNIRANQSKVVEETQRRNVVYPSSKVEEKKQVIERPSYGNIKTVVEQKSKNSIITSRSADNVQRIWKPTPQSRIAKPDQSTSIQPNIPEKKPQPKRQYPRQNNPKPDETNRSEPQQNPYARKPIVRQNMKSLPAQETSIPQQQSNRYPYSRQQPQQVVKKDVQNTHNSIKITNGSIRTSGIQNKITSPPSNNANSYTNQIVRKQGNIVSPVNTNQSASTKNIINVQKSPFKDGGQTKSQPQIQANQKSTKLIPAGSSSQKINKVQNNHKQESSSQLKRSAVLLHVIARLIMEAKRKSLYAIKSAKNLSKRLKQEAIILAHSSSSLVQKLRTKNFLFAFEQIKKNFVGELKVTKDVGIKSNETKNRVASLFSRFLIQKMKTVFVTLKSYSWYQKQLSIQGEDKKKVTLVKKESSKHKYEGFRDNFSSIITISRNYHKDQVKKGFNRIMISSVANAAKKTVNGVQGVSLNKREVAQVRSPQKPASKDLESEKKIILNNKANLESTIQSVQYQISDTKRGVEREKGKIVKKMQDLRRKNKKSETEVSIKKRRNEDLKTRLTKQSPRVEVDLPDDESLVETLTRIYAEVFKSGEDVIDQGSLVRKYNLTKTDSLIEEWGSLVLNMQLKADIVAYEGCDKKEGKFRKALRQQGVVQTDLLKNCIRERYMWEWVHAASLKL